MLLITGVLALGTAAYLAFLRPPMLPEDARFTGVPTGAVTPRTAEWLHLVFRTWGGFMAAFGLLLIAVAVHLLTGRAVALRWGAALAVVVAFGGFVITNLVLGSDFLPLIVGEAVFAVATASVLVARRPPS